MVADIEFGSDANDVPDFFQWHHEKVFRELANIFAAKNRKPKLSGNAAIVTFQGESW